MQTHCPHCDTRFRVTETQIELADGLVRCGICEHVFNVYEVADKAPAYDEDQQPMPDNHQQENSDEHAIEIAAEPDSGLYTADEADKEPYETDESFSSFNDLADDDSEIRTEDISETHNEAHSEAHSETLSESNAEKFVPDEPDKDSFNFFEDNEDNSPRHVVPEEYRDSYPTSTHSTASTILWSIGILFLTAALFIEYAWFNRDQFSHIPEIQAEVDKLCQQFDCSELSLRAPSKIELVTRNIYSHPNEKDVLIIDVTMKNNAAFSQPYPVMKIDFSDIRGGTVASRSFLPGEYLTKPSAGDSPYTENQHDSSKPQLLAPDTSSDITMEILDPGKQAMTYEFNFL